MRRSGDCHLVDCVRGLEATEPQPIYLVLLTYICMYVYLYERAGYIIIYYLFIILPVKFVMAGILPAGLWISRHLLTLPS